MRLLRRRGYHCAGAGVGLTPERAGGPSIIPDRTGLRRAGTWACRRIALLLIPLALAGCLTIGSERLTRDEADFARALAVAQNQQTLLNIVRLRYGEAPTFLDLTQVISGYQAQQNVNGAFELFPRDNLSTYIGGGGSLQLQESPTFTYEPVTGEQFADTFLRPLAPATVLPLALGGIPIDLVFALVVQSVDDLDNEQALSGAAGIPSPGFAQLLRDLRALQLAGLLDVRLGPATSPPGASKAKLPVGLPDSTLMSIRDTDDPALRPLVADARHLLDLPPDALPFTIVYGRHPSGPRQVAILTRSVLTVLGAVAFAIEVPPADVASGRTLPTLASECPITIHSGPFAPDDAFVSVRYERHAYWLSSRDFASKLGFSVLQILLALAETKHAPGAVVTIPAG